MQKRTTTSIVTTFLVLGMLLLIAGCGGDGDNNGGNDAARTSIIQGQVAQVTAALQLSPQHLWQWAQLWDSLLQPRLAHAQAGASTAGIRVTARQNGTAVDTQLTDLEGRFTLLVMPGNVTLVFATVSFSGSIDVTVSDESTLSLVVILGPTAVVIDESAVSRGALSCSNRTLDITESADLIIDGAGDACIRTESNCDLSITAPNIFLQNCASCVRAEGNSTVTLDAGGEIDCTAFAQGVRAEGTAAVELFAEEEIFIDAGEQGIRAAGTSSVRLESPRCIIHGDEEGIRRDGVAIIDTDECIVLNVTQ